MTESNWKKFWNKWDDFFNQKEKGHIWVADKHDWKKIKKEFCVLLREEEKKSISLESSAKASELARKIRKAIEEKK